jgi:hypothetical protein
MEVNAVVDLHINNRSLRVGLVALFPVRSTDGPLSHNAIELRR